MSGAFTIRPAVGADREAVAAFTTDTFDWGDYVPDAFAEWLGQPGSHMVVAVDAEDTPVGVSRARFVSPSEAWFHAARVDPAWRGRGIAGEMAAALRTWAASEGAIVGRLLIEDWNESSIRHVEKIGFRKVVGVVRGVKAVGDASPSPNGNGGRRVPSRLRARQAHAADAAPAFASWSVGELGRASRGLTGSHWTYARLTVDHLVSAARRGAFWEIGGGWAVADAEGDRFEVAWVESRREDVPDLLRALIDVGIGSGAEAVVLWAPAVDWMVQAARRLGFDTEPMGVFEVELP